MKTNISAPARSFLLLTIISLTTSAWATCSTTGDITGANGAIILGAGGCATSGNQATIFSGASITNAGDALTAPTGTFWQITNNGSIQATGGAGVNLQGDTDTLTNSGSIQSDGVGVYLQGGGGTLTNEAGGTIMATSGNAIFAPDVPGSAPVILTNGGTINASSGGSGALLLGGATVINESNSTIEGAFTGLSLSANGPSGTTSSTVINAGTIQSTSGFNTGIVLGEGGTVINLSTGLIQGAGVGLQGSGGNVTHVINQGTIGGSSTSTAIGLGGGGSVVNANGGLIQAQSRGITVTTSSVNIDNAGTIEALNGRAIDFNTSGGTINNTATGVIDSQGIGTRAIIFENGPGVVNNAGLIEGGLTATIEMDASNSTVNNSGIINGEVLFKGVNDNFIMTAGSMSGLLQMGEGGNETATFQNVTNANMDNITTFNGGGGGNDQLIFDNTQYTGANKLVNWETISVNNGSVFTLSDNLILGGLSSDPTATLNINNATLKGNDPSALNAIIKSNTGVVLVNNSGVIDIASPGENNSLTIQGNYVGNGGSIKINTVLNGDSSPSDKLIIDGQNGASTASGNSFFDINNVGGTGVKTTANGIEVVKTTNGATTNVGAFSLAAPVQAGAYQYMLYQGGTDSDSSDANNWYLRSELTPEPIPEQGPVVAYRPAIVGYTMMPALNLNYGFMTLGDLNERVGDIASTAVTQTGKKSSFWARLGGQNFDANNSNGRFSTSAQSYFAQFGKDWTSAETAQTEGSSHVGLMFTPGYESSSFSDSARSMNPTLSDSTGTANTNAESIGAYWTKYLEDGTYFDTVSQGSYYNNRYKDVYNDTAHQNGYGLILSQEVGKPLRAANMPIQVEPEAQLMYQYLNLNGFNDGISSISGTNTNALRSRVGLRVFMDNQTNTNPQQKADVQASTVFVPYLTANILHDFLPPGTTTIGDVNFNSGLSQTTWYDVGLGFTLASQKAGQLYANLEYAHNLGGTFQQSVFGQVGYRYSWV